ncbi:MAG TPA: TRAP transporter small permease [Egibacteraceae bacterium]|nr:TRAP transporter small permease [Egibacteraceae bacterium]
MRTITAKDAASLGWPPWAMNLIRAVHAVASAMFVIGAVLLFALIFLTVADVARRKYLGGSIPGAIEFTEVGLVALVFAGMTPAEVARAHVRTPILTSALPARAASVVRLVGLLIVTAVLAWLTVLTWRLGIQSLRQGEYRFGIAAVPIWPAKMVIPLGIGGMAAEFGLQVALTVHSLIAGRRRGSLVEEVLLTGEVASRVTEQTDDEGAE